MEGTTTATPTNFSNKSFNENVYAIVRQKYSKQLRMIVRPCRLSHIPTEKEVRGPHAYASSLCCAYSDYLPAIPDNSAVPNVYERWQAIAMMDTIKNIRSQEDVVACSHRFGGWTGIEWNFGEDVKFIISTNFGFGSCSYFYLLVKYKDQLLTPYTDYIRYRYADFSSLHRYTHTYGLEVEQWEKVMNDALGFYNAVVYKREGYVFSWLIDHLERMTSGIEELKTALSYSFYSPSNGSGTQVTGDELTLVKANKIANSLDFVENISALPVQVNPQRYVDRILSVCRTHLSDLVILIDKLEREKEAKEEELEILLSEADYVTYEEIRCRCYNRLKWNNPGKKRSMLRFLLRLLHRYMPSVSRQERKSRIQELKALIKKVEERKREISHLKNLITNLSSCRNKIEKYFEKEASKSA